MLSFLTYLLFPYLSLKVIFSLLFGLYLWQLKEYRPDRLLAHLKTKEGKKHIISFFNFLSFSGFRKPKFTFKTTFIFLLSLRISFHFFFIFWQLFFDILLQPDKLIISSLLALLALNCFTPFLISFLVFLFSPFVFLFKKSLVFLAKRKLKHPPNLLVIGITGSYGKTSSKNFLTSLLVDKYSVLNTPGSQNTEIAVAQTILFHLQKYHQVFIVEMGAYQKGEIKTICQIVNPRIGILTGIDQQHQSLFGSLENIILAKDELIQALPAEGLAVFNHDNFFCRQLAKKTKKAKLLYSIKEKKNAFAENIKISRKQLSFDLVIGNDRQRIILNLCGQQNISNFLGAALVARKLGISPKSIARKAKKIKPQPGNMVLIKNMNLTIVDDSFSSNPHGFRQALKYLKLYKKEKRIVVTPGIIELGKAAQEIHHLIGQEIGKIADFLILTNDNFSQPLFSGALKTGMKKDQLILAREPEKIIKILKDLRDKKTVILIEGRIPEKTKKLIISNI